MTGWVCGFSGGAICPIGNATSIGNLDDRPPRPNQPRRPRHWRVARHRLFRGETPCRRRRACRGRAARTVGGLEELDDEIKAAGGQATLVPLDLADMAGIDRLGGAIHERWGKLDVMVANAAMLGVIAPLGHVEAKVFDKVMQINVTATWRLIRSVDPLLRSSDAGRGIGGHVQPRRTPARAFWGPHAARPRRSRTMMRSWADETKNYALRVNAFDPGRTRTAMRAQAMPGENLETVPHPSEVAPKPLVLADPAPTETGKIYQANRDRFPVRC